jgi:OOP family OmpA-OmpF porin
MRLRALLFVLTAFAGLGAGARWIAVAATDHVERTSAGQAAEGLAAAGEHWAQARADGLTLILSGAAPDEASRLRAAEILRRVVEPDRVVDRSTLATRDPLAPPAFALELLRNGREVSLIGLAPETAGPAAIDAALTAGGLNGAVSDMLESVAHPPPEGWEAALAFGLDVLGDLPMAKISVAPGRVAVAALASSEDERRATEATLRAAAPDGVAVEIQVDAPRPAIDPFRVEFTLSGGSGRLTACAAETEADAAAILEAAQASDCDLGLGAPAPEWADAATAGIEAARALGAGRFSMSGHDARLSGAEGTAPERLRAVGEGLRRRLPAAISLTLVAPRPPERAATAGHAPTPRFDAFLLPDGAVRLAGPVRDSQSREAIASFAAALFGHDRVVDATVIEPDLPEGWPGRVLAGVEALSMMKEGRLEVTPQIVAVEGEAAHAEAEAQTAALFAEKDLGRTRIALRYDAAAAARTAAAQAKAADPVGACTRALAEAQMGRSIAFEPGAATLEAAGEAAVAAIAAAVAGCPPLEFEIAGHTDGQGRAESNQRLSEERAATVKAALEAAGVEHVGLTARGYGAEHPVADNRSEDGRARNRRIEFTLIGDPAAVPPAEALEKEAAAGTVEAAEAQGGPN